MVLGKKIKSARLLRLRDIMETAKAVPECFVRKGG